MISSLEERIVSWMRDLAVQGRFEHTAPEIMAGVSASRSHIYPVLGALASRELVGIRTRGGIRSIRYYFLEELRSLAEQQWERTSFYAQVYKGAWLRYHTERFSVMSRSQIRASDRELEEVSLVCERYMHSLLEFPDVVGFGTSYKLRNFEVTDIPSIVIFVRRKYPLIELASRPIPTEIGGVPTDIVEGGLPGFRAHTSRIRPAPPGYSIGHGSVTAGTLGCMVRDRRTSEVFILSNCHVLGGANDDNVEDPILQPGASDGGSHPSDVIGTLHRFIPIVSGINLVDAAVARPVSDDSVSPNIVGGIGVPTGAGSISRLGEIVQKVGRTTEHTVGYVAAIDATIPLNQGEIQNAIFTQSIVTTGMSMPGDSGSLLLDHQRRGVGLLFAGLSSNGVDMVTYYNHLNNVLSALGVDLVTS